MLYMQLFEKTKDLWIMDGMLRLLSLSVSSLQFITLTIQHMAQILLQIHREFDFSKLTPSCQFQQNKHSKIFSWKH